MVFAKQVSFENLQFKFNSSDEIKDFIQEIGNIVGYNIPFYIENSTYKYGYVRLPIAVGTDLNDRLSIYCYDFDNISEGYLLHELLHLYRFANQIPVWNPVGSKYLAQDYIILDDLIEHNWIYKKFEDFSINFDPRKDLIDRSRIDIKLKDIKEVISELSYKNRNDIYFKYKTLLVSLVALELYYNCPNNSFTKKLKKIMNLDESSIISQTISTLEDFLKLKGTETKETKLEFIKLMVESLNFPDTHKKYMVYQKKWNFFNWN